MKEAERKGLEGMRKALNKWRVEGSKEKHEETPEKQAEAKKSILDRWKKLEEKEGQQESYETWKERRSQQNKRKASDSDTMDSTDMNTLHGKKYRSENLKIKFNLTNLNCSNSKKNSNVGRVAGGQGQVEVRADGGDGVGLAMVDVTSARAADPSAKQTSSRGWENFLAKRLSREKAGCGNDLK